MMTAHFIGNELNTLIQETKRKLPNVKSAAEKSLQELKSLPSTSEKQLTAGR